MISASACCQVAASIQAEDDAEVGALPLAFAAGLKRGVEVGIQRSDCALRKYADDGVGLSFEVDRLADQIAVGTEGGVPEVVAEDDGLRSFRGIFSGGEGAPDGGADAKHLEVAR